MKVYSIFTVEHPNLTRLKTMPKTIQACSIEVIYFFAGLEQYFTMKHSSITRRRSSETTFIVEAYTRYSAVGMCSNIFNWD